MTAGADTAAGADTFNVSVSVAVSAAAGTPVGKLRVKVLPTLGSLVTRTLPPMRMASCLVMASPSPVPPYLRVVELSACEKDWKSSPILSRGMPIPVSSTSN